MPEFKGFETRDNATVAVIDYPHARAFSPQADGRVIVAPAPRTERLDRAALAGKIERMQASGADPGFLVNIEERWKSLDRSATAAPRAGTTANPLPPRQPS